MILMVLVATVFKKENRKAYHRTVGTYGGSTPGREWKGEKVTT